MFHIHRPITPIFWYHPMSNTDKIAPSKDKITPSKISSLIWKIVDNNLETEIGSKKFICVYKNYNWLLKEKCPYGDYVILSKEILLAQSIKDNILVFVKLLLPMVDVEKFILEPFELKNLEIDTYELCSKILKIEDIILHCNSKIFEHILTTKIFTEIELNSYLFLASSKGKYEIVEILLKQKNIDVNYRNENGLTSLMIAIKNKNEEIIDLLLYKSDINIKNIMGNNALIIALDSKKFCYKKNTIEKILKVENLDVTSKNIRGDTALMFACYYGDSEIVKKILAHDTFDDINVQNIEGFTPLMYCVIFDHKIDSGGYSWSDISERKCKTLNDLLKVKNIDIFY